MKGFVDTNIVIDYLNGVEGALKELGRYAQPAISAITFVEVLVGGR
jgi:predicted nucleic acid-binding protein